MTRPLNSATVIVGDYKIAGQPTKASNLFPMSPRVLQILQSFLLLERPGFHSLVVCM